MNSISRNVARFSFNLSHNCRQHHSLHRRQGVPALQNSNKLYNRIFAISHSKSNFKLSFFYKTSTNDVFKASLKPEHLTTKGKQEQQEQQQLSSKQTFAPTIDSFFLDGEDSRNVAEEFPDQNPNQHTTDDEADDQDGGDDLDLRPSDDDDQVDSELEKENIERALLALHQVDQVVQDIPKSFSIPRIKGKLLSANSIAEFLKALNAQNVNLINVGDKGAAFAKHFVIVSGLSSGHLRKMADLLVKELRARKVLIDGRPPCVIDRHNPIWKLVDTGTTLVHFMDPEARKQYAIDELWSDDVLHDDPNLPLDKKDTLEKFWTQNDARVEDAQLNESNHTNEPDHPAQTR